MINKTSMIFPEKGSHNVIEVEVVFEKVTILVTMSMN